MAIVDLPKENQDKTKIYNLLFNHLQSKYTREDKKEQIAESVEERKNKEIIGNNIDILNRDKMKIQHMTVYDFAKEYTPKGWVKIFQEGDEDLKNISNNLDNIEKVAGNDIRNGIYPYYPLKKDLFRTLELTPANKVRVVIVGQDPYPNLGHDCNPVAQGMSFSVNQDTPVPGSLRNIFKEIKDEYGDEFEIPQHGDLTAWGKQGILFLNKCLTVSPGAPDSHGERNFWEGFVIRIIKEISELNPYCIYVLWGRKAEALSEHINKTAHILTSGHPSPMAVKTGDFFGNGHFKEINRLLTMPREKKSNSSTKKKEKEYFTLGDPIDWNLPELDYEEDTEE